MKTPAFFLTFTSTLVLALAPTAAHADTACGDVQKRIVQPQCNPDEMCAQYFRIAHILVSETGETELQTANQDVLVQIVQSEGASICVEGRPTPNFFEVNSIVSAN